MPIQSPAWNDFLSCPVCCLQFDGSTRPPISLGCGHTLCAACLNKLHTNHCPFDQTEMNVKFSELPINRAILSLMSENVRRGDHRGVGSTPSSIISSSGPSSPPPATQVPSSVSPAFAPHYLSASMTVCKIALFLRPCVGVSNLNLSSGGSGGALSRSMQRKLVTLINCQLLENEGRARAIRAARSLGERTVTELILHHQNHHQLSATLWAAVRSRGCQFLGPAMQEEVIRLVLLALEDGSALSRKVLVMFVVQRLEPHFPQASKTSIGHVVQLLYRASCFKVSKRERDSSLMQLKEEFRCYDSLRREHDTQIVQIATEAGLRIAPDQWSSLLYGDVAHKSHMQSIMDKLQTADSFAQSVNELLFVLHRTGDPGLLTELWPQLEILAKLDPGGGATNGSATSSAGETNSASSDGAIQDATEPPSSTDSNSNSDEESGGGWQTCADALSAVHSVLAGLVHFLQHFGHRRLQDHHYHAVSKYRPAGSSGRHPPIRHGGPPPAPNTPHSRFEEDNRARSRYANNAAVNNNHHHTKGQQQENESVSATSPKAAGLHENPSPLIDNNASHYQHPSVKSSSNFNVINSVPKGTNVHCHSVPPPPLQHSNSSAGNNGLQANSNSKEQIMNSVINQTPMKMFDTPKVVGMTHQSQQPPYLSFPSTPPNLVRVPTGPAQSTFVHPGSGHTLYASTGMSPDFGSAYSPFAQQATMYGNATNVASTSVYPQAATPILTAEIYPSNAGTPQAVLLNSMPPMNHHVNAVPQQGQIYNVISPSTLEILYPVHKGSNAMQQSQQLLQPMPQHMSQQLMPQAAVIGPWYDFASPQGLLAEMRPPVPSTSTHSTWSEMVNMAEAANNVTSTTSTASLEPTLLKKKSLSELQELKENIVTRLQTIVGKKETEEVEEHIAKNQEHIPCVIPQTLGSSGSNTPAFTSTYSIWTSGANFYSIARSCIEKEKSGTLATATADCETNAADSNMFSDESTSPCSSNNIMPGVSQFGPISKRQMTRSSSSTGRPIQVSASNNVNSTTTSTIGTNYPLLSLSPMPHQAVLFPSSGAGAGMGYPAFGVGVYHHPVRAACLEATAMPTATLNTIHHGIIDPPHLHMSQLDPSGSRPSDPLDKNFRHNGITGSREERQRQQLNAVTECIDPFHSVKDMPEERRLKQELSFVMHGIQEKLNVRQQAENAADLDEQQPSKHQKSGHQLPQQLQSELLQQHESWLPRSSSGFELQETWQ